MTDKPLRGGLDTDEHTPEGERKAVVVAALKDHARTQKKKINGPPDAGERK